MKILMLIMAGLILFGIFLMSLYYYKKYRDAVYDEPILTNYMEYVPPTNHRDNVHTAEI
jgi:hypothetical protein